MPLGLEATQHFLALDHLLEQTLQKGPSPDHTESSLIMISIINVEKQGVQQRYPKTEKMIFTLVWFKEIAVNFESVSISHVD